MTWHPGRGEHPKNLSFLPKKIDPWNTPLKTNMSLQKGTILVGNTSSNHWFSRDMLVFRGVSEYLIFACQFRSLAFLRLRHFDGAWQFVFYDTLLGICEKIPSWWCSGFPKVGYKLVSWRVHISKNNKLLELHLQILLQILRKDSGWIFSTLGSNRF